MLALSTKWCVLSLSSPSFALTWISTIAVFSDGSHQSSTLPQSDAHETLPVVVYVRGQAFRVGRWTLVYASSSHVHWPQPNQAEFTG